MVEWPSGLGLVGLFEGFEERGVLGNDMILERGRQQQHQQKQLNKTTTTTTNNQLGAKWMERATRQECVGGAVEEQETHRERESICVLESNVNAAGRVLIP